MDNSQVVTTIIIMIRKIMRMISKIVSELADVLGLLQVGNLLDRTLEEEEDTNALLTEIAEEINDEAADQEE
jgi:ferritin-like metal-binding protein YciE